MIACRTYGERGAIVVLLHGGPGAPGYLAPLARALADEFRVIEPFQRRSEPAGGAPLTVARHVGDLHEVIAGRCGGERPHIVGHSWGAMLGLAYGAEHAEAARSLVLIGCGTFDEAARGRMNAIRAERMTAELRARLARLEAHYADEDERLRAMGRFHQMIDSVELVRHADESAGFDARGHEETWGDMLRLQREGVYPAAFAAVRAPVLMLHGEDDPHPGEMIRESLARAMPQLEYESFGRCGHYPWIERAARVAFLGRLREWLRG